MAQSWIIVCVALATLVHLSPVSSTGFEVIKTGLTDVTGSTKNIVTGLIGNLKQEANALDDLPGINQITSLLNGLIGDLPSLLQALQLTATDLLKGALQNLLDAVTAIKGVVLQVAPLLNTIVETLGNILQEVINLVNQVLSLVVNLLGSLSGNLDVVIKKVLGEVQKLGNTLIETLGNVLSTQLTNITNAVGSIVGFLQSNVLSKLSELSKEVLALVVGFIGRLLQADNLISALIQGILSNVFALVNQLKGALQGLLSPILATLTGTLNQLTSCVSCLGGGLLGLGRRRRAIA